jgi:hypothetical protein
MPPQYRLCALLPRPLCPSEQLSFASTQPDEEWNDSLTLANLNLGIPSVRSQGILEIHLIATSMRLQYHLCPIVSTTENFSTENEIYYLIPFRNHTRT